MRSVWERAARGRAPPAEWCAGRLAALRCAHYRSVILHFYKKSNENKLYTQCRNVFDAKGPRRVENRLVHTIDTRVT